RIAARGGTDRERTTPSERERRDTAVVCVVGPPADHDAGPPNPAVCVSVDDCDLHRRRTPGRTRVRGGGRGPRGAAGGGEPRQGEHDAAGDEPAAPASA